MNYFSQSIDTQYQIMYNLEEIQVDFKMLVLFVSGSIVKTHNLVTSYFLFYNPGVTH